MTLTAKTSLGKDYICLKNWPNDTFVQCGGRGIVFSKNGNNYRTAFFEAFPKEPSTFIRGEGSSIEEAEANAFLKFERIINCDGHDFQRKGNTETATCSKCKLTLIDYFPPVFHCSVCGKESVNYSLGDKSYCQHHFLEEALKLKEKFTLSFLEQFLEIESKESFISRSEENPFENILMEKFFYEKALFTSIALKHLPEIELPEYKLHHKLTSKEITFNRYVANKCQKYLDLMHSKEIKDFEYFILPTIEEYICFKPELYEQLLLEFLNYSNNKPVENIVNLVDFCETCEYIWQKIYAQDLKETRAPDFKEI